MADYGEWNRKGAVLSDVTAQKEYGMTREFVVAGINAGKLEYREGSVWGNPYLRVLRSQLEPYIAAELGAEYLSSAKSKTELRAIVSEIAGLRKKLALLEARKALRRSSEQPPGRESGDPPLRRLTGARRPGSARQRRNIGHVVEHELLHRADERGQHVAVVLGERVVECA
jgi:hypothetical protein